MKKILLLCTAFVVVQTDAQIKRSSGSIPLTQADIMLVDAKKEADKARDRSETTFILKGKVIGQSAGYIYLSYANKNGKRVRDSSQLKGSEFKFTGEIIEPTLAWLEGRTKSRSMDDPNTTSVFLEPVLMTFVAKLDDFKNALVTGSKTHKEYNTLAKSKEPIREKMEPVLQEYMQANAIYSQAVKDKKDEAILDSLKNKAADIREKFGPYNAAMSNKDYEFFAKHPDSYVTAYQLQFHVSQLPLDSLQLFYNAMSKPIQQSKYGKTLEKEIEQLRGGSPGSMAKGFAATDINGNQLKLADFKGKYVLLDFWASWCVPCRKGNPHLKELYSKYKAKGIEFIGISDDDRNHNAWRKAVEKDGLPWRHVLRGLDMEKRMKNEPNEKDISEKFGIHTLPTKILINPTGMIIGRYGEEEDELDKKLAEIFK